MSRTLALRTPPIGACACEAHACEPDPNTTSHPAAVSPAHREQACRLCSRSYRVSAHIQPSRSQLMPPCHQDSSCAMTAFLARQIPGAPGPRRTKSTSGSRASLGSSLKAGMSSTTVHTLLRTTVLIAAQSGKPARFATLRVPHWGKLLLQRRGALRGRRAILHPLSTAHRAYLVLSSRSPTADLTHGGEIRHRTQTSPRRCLR